MTDVTKLGTILGVWAHPDDETYLTAGVMAQARRAGQRVVCITATRGEAGSQDEDRWPSATIAKVREAELLEALGILGVTEHRFLDYIDGHCPEVDDGHATARIETIIGEVEPDTVFCFGPDGGTGHTDHIATHRWTTAAFRAAAKSGARLYYPVNSTEWAEQWLSVLEPFNVFEPGTPTIVPGAEMDLRLELTGDQLDLKLAALRTQVSQTEGLINAFGEDGYRRAMGEEGFVLAAEA